MGKKFLEKKLNIGKIIKFSIFNEGYQNIIYLINSSKGKYCLRISKRRSYNHVLFEAKVYEKLKYKFVPKIIKINGKLVFCFNKRPAILYEYIEGNIPKKIDTVLLEEIGKKTALMNLNLKNFVWNKRRFEFYNLTDSKIRIYKKFILRKKIKYLNLLPQIIYELKLNKPHSNLIKGAIHVDIGPKNVIVNKNKISAIIDFDNGYIGPLVLDLGKAIMFFCSKNKKFDLNKAKMIINSYKKVRKLNFLEYKLYKIIKYSFLSHIFMDYYMRALKYTPQVYFEWIINELYESYKDFKISEYEFYKFLEKK
jgi:Ser/Thr protein kinase RdoA (MazF antagonist)